MVEGGGCNSCSGGWRSLTGQWPNKGLSSQVGLFRGGKEKARNGYMTTGMQMMVVVHNDAWQRWVERLPKAIGREI